jgi:hypothetical protein
LISLRLLRLVRVQTYLHTEHTGASLVESRCKRNVEGGASTANGEINVGVCPWMAAVEDHAAACQGPLCAVCGVCSSIDAGARVRVLAGGCLERVAAPYGLEKTEMRGCAAREGGEGDECGKHCEDWGWN